MAAALCYGVRGGGAQLAFHVTAGNYDTDTLIQVLGELRRFLGGEKATLLWDGLPAHRSRAMRAWLHTQRSWLVVERLPGYAPELNPTEGLWSSLKAVELANLVRRPWPRSSSRHIEGSSGCAARRTGLLVPAARRLVGLLILPGQRNGLRGLQGGIATRASGAWRLKQLDGVASRIIQQDLLATKPAHDVVAELRPRLAQGLDLPVEVIDLQLDAVPAARLGFASVGHGLGGPAGSARCIQQQP